MTDYKEVKSILNKHKKRDSRFFDDYSLNPYEGCGFNCTYCYVHGSKYGENLAEKIVIKKDGAAILEKQLASRAKKKQFGAEYLIPAGLTLFGNDERDSKRLVFKFLKNYYPHLNEKYEKMYGPVYYPSWKYQELLKKRTDAMCEKYEIKSSIR